MLTVAKDYPFVEWGILLSTNKSGSPRFPSYRWLIAFADSNAEQQLKVSAHLCGGTVRDYIDRGRAPAWLVHPAWRFVFNRYQVNTHGIAHPMHPEYPARVKAVGKECIVQMDNENNHLLDALSAAGCKVSALFDLSHGAGTLPSEWPAALNVPCGYAGGLSPRNVKEQLARIEQVVGDGTVWIDAETHLRTDEQFDMGKVTSFLEAAAPYAEVSR
jgi:hypothetical protein